MSHDRAGALVAFGFGVVMLPIGLWLLAQPRAIARATNTRGPRWALPPKDDQATPLQMVGFGLLLTAIGGGLFVLALLDFAGVIHPG